MSRLAWVGKLYDVSGEIGIRPGAVELVAVADPGGASFDRAVRELGREVRDGNAEILGDLLGAARRLRWRLSIEPFPASYSADRSQILEDLGGLAERCRPLVGSDTRWILDELLNRASAASSDSTPQIGEFLLGAMAEPGHAGCVVVVAATRTAGEVRSWLRQLGIPVPVMHFRQPAGTLVHERAYLLGPPSLFGATVIGAPRARNLSYVIPSWVQDRTLPLSEFSTLATGGIRPRVPTQRIGDEAFIPDRLRETEDRLRPEPVWRHVEPRIPAGDEEVYAHRVLLSGGLSMMLDKGGESIRTLDPYQPAGARVEMRDVGAVVPGTYVVLREGQTESGPLYGRAIAKLGAQAEAVETSQAVWKAALRQRLLDQGRAEVVRKLRAIGIKAAAQAPAWPATTLARPQDQGDFGLVLSWLGLPVEPYRQNANMLRRARIQAMTDVREALEAALGDGDMAELERTGVLKLNLELEGFAGIIATRVLAISPHVEVVPRSELRIPKEDASARWLE